VVPDVVLKKSHGSHDASSSQPGQVRPADDSKSCLTTQRREWKERREWRKEAFSFTRWVRFRSFPGFQTHLHLHSRPRPWWTAQVVPDSTILRFVLKLYKYNFPPKILATALNATYILWYAHARGGMHWILAVQNGRERTVSLCR
jgi:hypothetical protein